jgi:hypothetical protein
MGAAVATAGEWQPVLMETRAGEAGSAEVKRYRTLLEINNAIITNLSKQDLLGAIYPALRRILPFDKAGMALYEAEIDSLRLFAIEGPHPLENFAVGQLAGKGHGASADASVLSGPARPAIYCALAVPYRSR